MKQRIFLWAFILCATLSSGCGSSSSDDDSPKLINTLAGDWHLVSWVGASPSDFDLYISFGSNGSFTIYQQVTTVQYTTYTGSFRLSKNTLTGQYADGSAWGGTYEISFDTTGNTLTLVSDSSLGEIHVYDRATIPSSVKEGAVAAASVRSIVPFL